MEHIPRSGVFWCVGVVTLLVVEHVFVYSLNYHVLEFHPRKLSLLSLHPPLLTIVMTSA